MQVQVLLPAPKHWGPNLLPIGETFGFVVFLKDVKQPLFVAVGEFFRFYQLFFFLLFLHSYAVDGDKMNNIQSHHTWNRVYFNGSWWDVDTTNDDT